VNFLFIERRLGGSAPGGCASRRTYPQGAIPDRKAPCALSSAGCAGCGGRLGRRFGRGGFRLRRLGFSGGLGVAGSGFGRRFLGRRAAFGSVVVDVPSGAFELKRGGGQGAMEFTAALGTGRFRLGVKLLDLLKSVTALVAAIFVKRQLEWLRGERSLSILIGTGAALFRHELRGLPGLASIVEERPGKPVYGYFAETGTEAEWFSQARVILPLPPPESSMVYFRFSTSEGGLDICILTLPRSWEPS
jgi:hypothetical protein